VRPPVAELLTNLTDAGWLAFVFTHACLLAWMLGLGRLFGLLPRGRRVGASSVRPARLRKPDPRAQPEPSLALRASAGSV
jgi:hypothetical protein